MIGATNSGPASRPSLAIEVAGNIAPNIAVGDLITVVCNAKGGNPSPALSLYLNHTEVGEPRYTQNTHSFQASAKDNSASVMCSAINSQTISPITSEIFLNILCKLASPFDPISLNVLSIIVV